MEEEEDKMGKEKIEKRVYTTDEIGAILNISKSTVYGLLKKGEFSYVKVGDQYRISKKSFDHWLDQWDKQEDEKSQGCESENPILLQ